MALREVNVEEASPDAHTTEPKYSGKDIALGITVQMQIGERRSIAFQTHVIRDCSEGELNGVLDKTTKALDRINSKYRIAELNTVLAQNMRQLGLTLENQSQTNERWQADWVGTGRKGPFKITSSQQVAKDQSAAMVDRLSKEVESIRAEIALLEKQVG